MGEFKTSGSSMSTGSGALSEAKRQIDSANTALMDSYGRLQRMWASSDARLQADKDYTALQKCLQSMTEWAGSGAIATDGLNELFGRVEMRGAFSS